MSVKPAVDGRYPRRGGKALLRLAFHSFNGLDGLGLFSRQGVGISNPRCVQRTVTPSSKARRFLKLGQNPPATYFFANTPCQASGARGQSAAQGRSSCE